MPDRVRNNPELRQRAEQLRQRGPVRGSELRDQVASRQEQFADRDRRDRVGRPDRRGDVGADFDRSRMRGGWDRWDGPRRPDRTYYAGRPGWNNRWNHWHQRGAWVHGHLGFGFHNQFLGWGPMWPGMGGWHFFNFRPNPWFWWGWPAPFHLNTWFAWGPQIVQPVYYDYGTVVRYEDYFIYVDDVPIATGPQYTEQALVLADQGREIVAQRPPVADYSDPDDWLPLGMFALVNESEGEPIMYVQLAVDKDGVMAGTYYNTLTESTLPIYGMVDPESQRAAWSVGERATTVMETGIFNLTEDVVPLLLHNEEGIRQDWLLVRLPPGDELEEGQALEP